MEKEVTTDNSKTLNRIPFYEGRTWLAVAAIMGFLGGVIVLMKNVSDVFSGNEAPPHLFNTLILVDTSIHMKQRLNGVEKWTIAQKILSDDIRRERTPNENTSLVGFGGSCTENQAKLIVDFDTNNIENIIKTLANVKPNGESMLSSGLLFSLRSFSNLNQFKKDSIKKIIVISSGIDSCQSDYQSIVKKELENLKKVSSGYSLSFHIIGLSAEAEDTNWFQKIADDTGGIAYFPSNTEEAIRAFKIAVNYDQAISIPLGASEQSRYPRKDETLPEANLSLNQQSEDVENTGLSVLEMLKNKQTGVSERKVFYAGVSFLGSYSLIVDNYPVALQLNDPKLVGRQNTMDNELLHLLALARPKHYKLETGLANLRRAESVVVSLAIEKERIRQEILGKYRKLIYEVGAQLLFMDFASMTLIANYPIALTLNHVIPVSQDPDKDKVQRFRELYFGSENQEGLIQLANAMAKRVQPFNVQKLRFQVANVSMSNKAKEFLPSAISDVQFSQYLGQYFTARLATQYDLPVLPYTKGYAVDNKMAGRFANGEVYNLTLPPPDYEFVLRVSDFKNIPKDSNYLYAARLGMKFSNRALNKDYINGFYHYAVAKLVSGMQTEVDDWSAAEDAIEALLGEWISQLAQPSKKWHEQHSANKSSYSEFKRKKELFNES